MKFTKEEMRNETNFQIGKVILKEMLDCKLITDEEYHILLKRLLTDFPSVFGRLFDE